MLTVIQFNIHGNVRYCLDLPCIHFIIKKCTNSNQFRPKLTLKYNPICIKCIVVFAK